MNYPDFANVVVNGRKNVNTAQESVMPSFGINPNVAPMTPFRAEDRKSTKTSSRR